MAETVKIVIDADDRSAKTIGGVHGALEKLSGFAKGALVGGLAAAGAAVVGLGAILVDSVQAAMEAQEAQAQLAQVIKSTGGIANVSTDDVNKWAGALQNATRYEDDATVAAASMLLTFTNINEEVFPRALELTLDMSEAFDQDLSASAMQLGKALNDPIEGLGALQRIGVQFTESQVALIKSLMGESEELEKLAKAAAKASAALPDLSRDLAVAKLKLQEMEASGKKSESQLLAQKNKVVELTEKIELAKGSLEDYETAQNSVNTGMSEAERLAKAQGVVMDELTKQVGGSAEAFGETLAGKLAILNNKFGDIKESVGNAVIPALTILVDQIGPKLLMWADKLAKWLQEDGAKAIETFASWIIDDAVPAIEKLVKWMGTDAPVAIDKANKASDEFMNGGGGAMLRVWQDIAKAIQDAIDAYNRWNGTQAGSTADFGVVKPHTPPPPPGPKPYVPPSYGGGYNMPMTFNITVNGGGNPIAIKGGILDALSLARARGML